MRLRSARVVFGEGIDARCVLDGAGPRAPAGAVCECANIWPNRIVDFNGKVQGSGATKKLQIIHQPKAELKDFQLFDGVRLFRLSLPRSLAQPISWALVIDIGNVLHS